MVRNATGYNASAAAGVRIFFKLAADTGDKARRQGMTRDDRG